MNAVTQAIYSLLAADSTLTALLSRFAGLPAIFSDPEIPRDASLPWLTLTLVTDVPDDTKTFEVRELIYDIGCWTRTQDGLKILDAIAERVRVLLHNTELTIEGWENYLTLAEGVIMGESDAEITGRIVSVRLNIAEE